MLFFQGLIHHPHHNILGVPNCCHGIEKISFLYTVTALRFLPLTGLVCTKIDNCATSMSVIHHTGNGLIQVC